jgi:hypothetical protein
MWTSLPRVTTEGLGSFEACPAPLSCPYSQDSFNCSSPRGSGLFGEEKGEEKQRNNNIGNVVNPVNEDKAEEQERQKFFIQKLVSEGMAPRLARAEVMRGRGT